MAKYRKKSVVIEAFQYDGDLMGSDGKYYVPDWAVKAFEDGVIYFDSLKPDGPPCEMFIKSFEEIYHANVGDYIVKTYDGDICPYDPYNFEKIYEKMEKEEV